MTKPRIRVAEGWGMVLGGRPPHMSGLFATSRSALGGHYCVSLNRLEPHAYATRIVRAVVVPMRDYSRLRQLARKAKSLLRDEDERLSHLP